FVGGVGLSCSVAHKQAPFLSRSAEKSSAKTRSDPIATIKPAQTPTLTQRLSPSRPDGIVSISPGIEERRRFRQLFLQVLHLAGVLGSGLSGFVALLLGASQQRLQRFDGGACSSL